ncbi:ABC transporter ATP-binding protein [Sporosalibacterium faouarense]|uniref:ABC transporter ATP-binding protein n=1 Tax=Sporosalibacterium faouarense TaxID=516123 RepID=UPI00192CA64F|nr:ABC transporter ATP-binding protein [Sporosalibacterium faouarense]
MSIIVSNLTKSFSETTGIFNIDFQVNKGEVLGYLGPNGAGKTTTIRHLMGFMQPNSGNASIKDFNCWNDRTEIQKYIGYLPGEINFIEGMSGIELLDLISNMRGLKNHSMRNSLIERFNINPNIKIKKMSKGMKQKIGLITAFMHDPEILILDEPSSGLDPLMQNELINLILEEKKRSKTILLSSHIFDEVRRTCDRISVIKDGRLVTTDTTDNLESMQTKIYKVTVKSPKDIQILQNSELNINSITNLTIYIKVSNNYKKFLNILSQCDIVNLDVEKKGLEDAFISLYKEEVE